jgi:DNA repair protein RadA/Sms
MSRVFSDRIDSARVSRVAAVMEKHLGMRLSDQDLYINVAGGIRISEVGVELALACALYSARTGIPTPGKTAIAGELSLAGEVRPLRRIHGRVKTAANLAFTSFMGPAATSAEDAAPAENLNLNAIIGVGTIKDAIKAIFSP